MMMAYDASDTPLSLLDDDTLNAVRSALHGYLSDSSDPNELQGALLRMSTEARDKNILAEQLLPVLKDLWIALPEVRAMTDAGEQVRVLQRVVAMCIREYYSA